MSGRVRRRAYGKEVNPRGCSSHELQRPILTRCARIPASTGTKTWHECVDCHGFLRMTLERFVDQEQISQQCGPQKSNWPLNLSRRPPIICIGCSHWLPYRVVTLRIALALSTL